MLTQTLKGIFIISVLYATPALCQSWSIEASGQAATTAYDQSKSSVDAAENAANEAFDREQRIQAITSLIAQLMELLEEEINR